MGLDIEVARSTIMEKLPPRARWRLDGTPLDFDFTYAATGLRRVNSGDVGGLPNESWANLLVFGSLDYAEGGGASPLVLLNASDATVCGLDVERREAIFAFNSRIDRFILTFTLLHESLGHGRPLPPYIGAAAQIIDPTWNVIKLGHIS